MGGRGTHRLPSERDRRSRSHPSERKAKRSGAGEAGISAGRSRKPTPKSRLRSGRGRSGPRASWTRDTGRGPLGAAEAQSLAEPGEPEAAEAHVAEHLLRLGLDAGPRRPERLVHAGENEVGERLRVVGSIASGEISMATTPPAPLAVTLTRPPPTDDCAVSFA